MSGVKLEISRITLPKYLNEEALQELRKQMDSIENSQPKIVVVEGTSSYFCHGLDFAWLTDHKSQKIQALAEEFVHFLNFLHRSPFISVAAVNGSTIGGGVGIAAACDLVISTHESYFQLTEGLFGLIPGAIFSFLIDKLTIQTIKRMIFTAEPLPATDAFRIGFVDEVIAEVDMDSSINKWVKKVGRCHPQSVKDTKEMLEEVSKQRLSQLGPKKLEDQLKKSEVQRRIRDFVDFGIIHSTEMACEV